MHRCATIQIHCSHNKEVMWMCFGKTAYICRTICSPRTHLQCAAMCIGFNLTTLLGLPWVLRNNWFNVLTSMISTSSCNNRPHIIMLKGAFVAYATLNETRSCSSSPDDHGDTSESSCWIEHRKIVTMCVCRTSTHTHTFLGVCQQQTCWIQMTIFVCNQATRLLRQRLWFKGIFIVEAAAKQSPLPCFPDAAYPPLVFFSTQAINQ